jgi:hypothetical protein
MRDQHQQRHHGQNMSTAHFIESVVWGEWGVWADNHDARCS